MEHPVALIIDDEPDILELLKITLGRMQIECRTATDLHSARKLLAKEKFDICLTDMRLPDGDGVEFVSYFQENYPHIPVAIITAHGSIETAIQALKLGAFDFLTKPVDLPRLRTLIDNALKLASGKVESGKKLVGESEQIQQIRKKVAKLARSQAPIYISGESGVGKELVARMIHDQSPRVSAPFVPVNCGAIPQELMESEFFGHMKGSFTGAVTDKKGLFQAADGGTLFLDEIAELPMNMQVKLLRAIQEKNVRPVGSQQENPVDVRILSATHKDLAELVEAGKFRQDLFYRINVIELHIPPLRQRKQDIPRLIEHIIGNIMPDAGNGDEPVSLSDSAMTALMHYSFPGNVRELENIIQRAIALAEGSEIDEAALMLPVTGNGDTPGNDYADEALDTFLHQHEKDKILAALEQTRWNKTAAAKLLGISFRALRYRLDKLGID
jgi:two-component system response regulator PilR (NtrC family)